MLVTQMLDPAEPPVTLGPRALLTAAAAALAVLLTVILIALLLAVHHRHVPPPVQGHATAAAVAPSR